MKRPKAGHLLCRTSSPREQLAWERLSSNVKTGRFTRVKRGIHQLTQLPGSEFEDLFATLLRTGPDSVSSHESALALYELSDVLPAEIHVTVPRTSSRRRPDIRQHTHRLDAAEVTTREGLGVTTVLRTLAKAAAPFALLLNIGFCKVLQRNAKASSQNRA